ncbi:hypothetical protein [Sporisorium scitamineum]|uniref:Myb-like domain-containing protein n=1 Tax=Sporisorium scitamineum TaxID=49012 RepID=A0A0F7RRV6_9BASI|nr:hypothetical protein [Sporisorium scitamineum]
MPIKKKRVYRRKALAQQGSPSPLPASTGVATPNAETAAKESQGGVQTVQARARGSSPSTPTKTTRKPKQGHWTRQEIMFLFHEVFPQNRTMDWQRVARIVGREAADCEARMPVLINDLETSITDKYPSI